MGLFSMGDLMNPKKQEELGEMVKGVIGKIEATHKLSAAAYRLAQENNELLKQLSNKGEK